VSGYAAVPPSQWLRLRKDLSDKRVRHLRRGRLACADAIGMAAVSDLTAVQPLLKESE